MWVALVINVHICNGRLEYIILVLIRETDFYFLTKMILTDDVAINYASPM